MFKSSKDFDKNMRRLLITIRDSGVPSELSQDDMHCLETCVARGYVTGIRTQRMASGHIVADMTQIVRIEKPGHAFIDNKHPNLRVNVAIIISVVALLISLLTGLTDMVDGVKWLLQLIR